MNKIFVREHHLLSAGANFHTVRERFNECQKDIYFVMDGKVCLGIITEKDYLSAMERNIEDAQSATEVMNVNFTYLLEDEISQIDEIMQKSGVFKIPVFDQGGFPKWVIWKDMLHKNDYFYCRVLTGLSTYNLSVNADLTVSCHCVLRESGELGSLKDSTLSEIFDAEPAETFRQNLLNGCLPTAKCLACPELVSAPKSLAKYYRANYQVPQGIMIENTSTCNLRCINCYNAMIEKHTISVHDFTTVAQEIRDNGVKFVALFKYGETFADPQLLEKIQILREYAPNMHLTVSTNGMLINRSKQLEAALLFNTITVSLDGINDATVEQFQNGSKFSTVISNVKELSRIKNERDLATPILIWKIVLFPWNDNEEYIEEAFLSALKYGFQKLHFVAGWGLDEKSSAIKESEIFLKYMNLYNFQYTTEGGGTLHFHLTQPKECAK